MYITLWKIFFGSVEEFQRNTHLINTGVIPPPLTLVQSIAMIFNMVHLSIILMSVGILSIYQTIYICSNTTTIETMEKDRVATLVRRKKIAKVWSYLV